MAVASAAFIAFVAYVARVALDGNRALVDKKSELLLMRRTTASV